MYKSSTALFPSIYLMEEHIQNHKFVAERLTEAFRVSLLVAEKSNNILPVYPYLRPLYLTSSHQFKMLKEVLTLIDWLTDWLISWLIDQLIDQLIGWSVDWLISWLIDWSVDWLIDWSVDWLISWLVDWSVDWLID